MTVHDIAADQLKCVRALSVILADGTLPMPQTWGIHTYPGYDPPIAPELEGLFLDTLTPSVSELREQLGVYADRLGLVLTEKPHGRAGMVGVHANGTWRGVEVHVWGPANAPVADVSDETPAEVIAAAKDAYEVPSLNASFPYYLDGTRIQDEDQPLAARGHGQDRDAEFRMIAQRAELHLDLTDEALSALAVQCSHQAVTR